MTTRTPLRLVRPDEIPPPEPVLRPRLVHLEPPRDAIRGEVLAGALCFGGALLILAVQVVRGWLA